MNFALHILNDLKNNPDRICLLHGFGSHMREYRSGELYQKIMQFGRFLKNNIHKKNAVIGIVMHNSPDWVVADLACLSHGITVLPLPLGFSRYQADFLASQCDAFLIDDRGRTTLTEKWLQPITSKIFSVPEILADFDSNDQTVSLGLIPSLPSDWTCKIIHTSGTTSRPKGVKQSIGGLDVILHALLQKVPQHNHKVYLSLVPLSLLIEQVTAIYLPLLSRGIIHFLEPDTPLIGEKNCQMDTLLYRLQEAGATAVTVPPAMLDIFLLITATNNKIKNYLQNNVHITVGGAPVSAEKIRMLKALNISVYEGYGLSENGSVVSTGTYSENKIGSVGKPLSHVLVRINSNNIVEIKSTSLFQGYSEIDPSACSISQDGWLDTGDIGFIDDEGYLYITGRAKNMLCLPNGRNVSPEQVEILFQDQPEVEQAILFLSDTQQLTIFLVVTPLFDINTIKKWSEEAFSEVERPDSFWIVAPNSHEWISIQEESITKKRKLLAEMAAPHLVTS